MFGWLGSWLGSWLESWLGAGGQEPPDHYLVTAKLDARIRKPELIAYVARAQVTACCDPLQVITGHIEASEPTTCPTGVIAAYGGAFTIVAHVPKASVVAYVPSLSLTASIPETQTAFGSFGTIIDACG